MSLPFNPTNWLALFETVGGAYALTGERLFLWILPDDLTAEERAKARRIISELQSSERAQIIEHLRTAAWVEA